jgi:hypothetical protein
MSPPPPRSENKHIASTALLATGFIVVSCLAYSPTLKLEANFPPKRRLTFNGLHNDMSQKIKPFEYFQHLCHEY